MHEIRQSLRALMRAPAFTLSALITLALGIGAAGAIFAIVSAVVLRPLPFPRPDRLVQVLETTQITPEGGPIARSKLERFRRQSQAIEALAG
jgi:hypothetical protein